MRDHEIIELYWARNESAIAATAEKYGSYCHTIAYICCFCMKRESGLEVSCGLSCRVL